MRAFDFEMLFSPPSVSMEADVLDDTKLEVLDDLATDSIHVCQGVQEVQDRRWQQYVSKAKLPLLQKVMNVFFIEPSTISSPYASDEVVLRSRQCKYYVKNPVRNQDPGAVDYVRCDQCSVFQVCPPPLPHFSPNFFMRDLLANLKVSSCQHNESPYFRKPEVSEGLQASYSNSCLHCLGFRKVREQCVLMVSVVVIFNLFPLEKEACHALHLPKDL